MKKSSFVFKLPLSLLLLCGPSLAGTINLGSIITNNIAVLGYDSSFASSTSIAVSNTGSSHINVTGNLVSPNFTGTSGVTFTAGSGTAAITTTEETDLASVVTQLNALSYNSLTLTSGGVNTIGVAGDYTINGTLGAGTVINLTGSGTYVFKTTTNTPLDLTNVVVHANASLSSDNVFWYTTGNFDIGGGSIFGDVVLGSGANPVLVAATGETPATLTGRILSQGFTTTIEAAQGATLNINDFQAAVPEPATFAFVFLGLGGLAALRRRR
jgi:hypothetical protein